MPYYSYYETGRSIRADFFADSQYIFENNEAKASQGGTTENERKYSLSVSFRPAIYK
jgi:hypothetical protein